MKLGQLHDVLHHPCALPAPRPRVNQVGRPSSPEEADQNTLHITGGSSMLGDTVGNLPDTQDSTTG